MAVTAAANDAAGKAIDAQITALAAQTQTPFVAQLLRQTRTEAVYHYMALEVGRIDPATILSTLS